MFAWRRRAPYAFSTVGVTIVAVWDTILGGAIALAGVALSQWWQWRRAREEATLRRAAEKAGRLRAAYHDVVTAADWLRLRAFELMDMSDKTEWNRGEWSNFVYKMTEDRPISVARTALALEAEDADRDVLAAFSSAQRANTSFKIALMNAASPSGGVSLHDSLRTLEGEVDDVVFLARTRLAELEQPRLKKKEKGWWTPG